MKKILLALSAAALLFAGCTKELEQRVGDLETTVEQLQSDLEALERAVENKLVVNSMTPVTDGYELTFSDGTKITIRNGKDGINGTPGTPGTDGQPGLQGPKGDKGDAFFESVTLSEDGAFLIITLVADEDGQKKVYELPMGAFNIMFEASDFLVKAGEEVTVKYTIGGAKDADAVVVRVLSVSNCEAVVDNAAKTIKVVFQSGAAYVDLYAINNATGEIKAKTLNFTEYTFSVANTQFHVSPAGGNIEVPVTTDVDYEWEVSAPWLTYVETRAVRNETMVFNASAANTSDTDLTAKVTLKATGSDMVLAEFDVIQKNYYPQWIADADEKPIVWAESFDLFKVDPAGDPDAAADVQKKGEFTFELSDDFSKGAFKIQNMFKAGMYFGEGFTSISNKGGVYYADVEGNTLTIYKNGSTMSYGFTSDFDVIYDPSANSFSIPSSLEATVYGDGFQHRLGYIVNYTASVKTDVPDAGGDTADLESLYGVYNESGKTFDNSNPAPETLVISQSDNSSYDLKMLFFYTEGQETHETAYGNVEADGKTITVTFVSMNVLGPVSKSITLTVNGATISGTIVTDFMGSKEYSATKEVKGLKAEDLVGTWTENYEMNGLPMEYNAVQISLSDDSAKGQLKIRMFVDEGYREELICYANLSADGTILTVLAKDVCVDSAVQNVNKFESNFDMTVNAEGTSLSFAGPVTTIYQYNYSNYTATKNQ